MDYKQSVRIVTYKRETVARKGSSVGKVAEMDTFRIEGTDKIMRGIGVPPGFWQCGDLDDRDEKMKRNMRAILQLFNIKVLVYPERVEVKGTYRRRS